MSVLAVCWIPLSCGLLLLQLSEARRTGIGDRARRVVSMNKVRGLVISCCEALRDKYMRFELSCVATAPLHHAALALSYTHKKA